jgi:hypothetical protein
MPQSFEDYLRSQGASAEDVKALTEGSFSATARRAFDKLQADLAAEVDARKAAEVGAAAYEERVNTWFETEGPKAEAYRNEAITAGAELAKAKAALALAEKKGLIKVAEQLGYKLDDAPPTRTDPSTVPSIDPNKYFTRDEILAIAQKEGEAIATAADIAYEHRVLFPDRPLNFKQLREKAVAAKKSVEQVWMEDFGVTAAREARAKADKDAYEKKLRDEGAAAERERLASEYGNPATRPLATSSNPFAFVHRSDKSREGKQPWDLGGGGDGTRLQSERVQRVTENLIKSATTN